MILYSFFFQIKIANKIGKISGHHVINEMVQQIRFTYDKAYYYNCDYLFVQIVAPYRIDCKSDECMFTRIEPHESEPSQLSKEELRRGKWYLYGDGIKILCKIEHIHSDYMLCVDLKTPNMNIPGYCHDVKGIVEKAQYLFYTPE